jgi:hypothetical protein
VTEGGFARARRRKLPRGFILLSGNHQTSRGPGCPQRGTGPHRVGYPCGPWRGCVPKKARRQCSQSHHFGTGPAWVLASPGKLSRQRPQSRGAGGPVIAPSARSRTPSERTTSRFTAMLVSSGRVEDSFTSTRSSAAPRGRCPHAPALHTATRVAIPPSRARSAHRRVPARHLRRRGPASPAGTETRIWPCKLRFCCAHPVEHSPPGASR